MPYDKFPQKFCLDAVITMYYTIPCVYYIPGVWQPYGGIPLQYPVYGLPHNLCLTLYRADSQAVLLKNVKPSRIADKKALQLIYSIKNILKMLQNILISHI